MIAGQGLFQLTTRSESYRNQALMKSPAALGASPNDKPAVLLPPGLAADSSPMGAFWQKAAKTASAHLPSSDTISKLQEASKSDNKEVAAQKMEQAKAKLQALRMQAQLAAASGDRQTLKRIAQEVASAARDVATAARDLAGGISASVSNTTGSLPVVPGTPADNSAAPGAAQPGQPQAGQSADGASGGTAATAAAATDVPAAGNAQGLADPSTGQSTKPARQDRPIYAQEPPADADPQAWGQKALHALSDDAGTAIAQAKGLLAFLANTARARRKPGERDDDDQFFRELSRSVDAAQHDMASAINQAGWDILTASAPDTGAPDAGSMTITTVTMTQVTVDVSLSLNITA